VAYLLKPLESKKLLLGLDRVRRLLNSDSDRAEEDSRVQRAAADEAQLQLVVGRKHGSFILLKSSDILWFYSEEGTVRARTTTDSYWVNYQLNQLERLLDRSTFFRARRETLVNLEAIKSIKGYDGRTFLLKMNDPNETEVLVSERQAKLLRRRLPGL
jgi:two-component system, LytTR family, response regulator LytT